MEATVGKTEVSKRNKEEVTISKSPIMHRICKDLKSFVGGRKDYIPCFKEENGMLKKIIMYYPNTEVLIDWSDYSVTINGVKQKTGLEGPMQLKVFTAYHMYKADLLDMVRKDLLIFPEKRVTKVFFGGKMVGLNITSSRYGNANITRSKIEIEKYVTFSIENGKRKVVKQTITKYADSILDNALIYFALKKKGYNN